MTALYQNDTSNIPIQYDIFIIVLLFQILNACLKQILWTELNRIDLQTFGKNATNSHDK